MDTPIRVRTDLRSTDIQPIIDLHGDVYAKEYGWNAAFKVYVASPLIEFQRSTSARNRIWIAETDQIAGCIAIVEANDAAQLRWFLVHPSFRRHGLGTRLLGDAIEIARDQRFGSIFLWTEQSLRDAARLYLRAGFERTETKKAWRWGAHVVEERWELKLT